MNQKKFNISRETYKAVKKMNHIQMNNYLVGVYNTAYNNGVEAITKTITDKIVKGLENTKGIGEKRMTEILTNINKEMTENNGQED